TAPDQIRATSAAIYFAQTIEWIQRVKAAIGRPQHSIFQSWLVTSGKSDIAVNLPETDTAVWSHTRLINEGLDALRTASVATPPPTVAATPREVANRTVCASDDRTVAGTVNTAERVIVVTPADRYPQYGFSSP